MLSKCANPDCSASFHYFGQGKLFEVHFENADLCEKAGRMPLPFEMKKKPRSVEHYWLCAECSTVLTVGLDRQNNVLILPIRKPVAAAAPVAERRSGAARSAAAS